VRARERLLGRLAQLGLAATPRLRLEVERRCLHGADIDATALAVARDRLPEANLARVDTLSAPVTRRFELVVGNPPYGAETAAGGESARHFIAHALDALAEGGAHSFIVPKALLYSQAWRRCLERLLPGLIELIDCGRAWPEVKLEQVVYVYESSCDERSHLSYRSSVRENGRVRSLGALDKKSAAEFGQILNAVSPAELGVGRKMLRAGCPLETFSGNSRGAPAQRLVRSRGRWPVYGGREIGLYRLGSPRGYLAADEVVEDRGWVEADAGVILAQNIVAHVAHPSPRLKITAALAPANAKAYVLDTVNKIAWRGPYSAEAALAILCSGPIAWYVYRFIVGRAIRTIHFDAPVTSRIPFPPRLSREQDRLLSRLGDQDEIDAIVCALFGLGKGEARAVRV
jgi:predicted RNA methylase